MKIFITGASGFIGSFFLRNLLKENDNEVLILLRNAKSAWRIHDVLSEVRVLEGELGNLTSIESELAAFSPDAIVHLAWDGVSGGQRNNVSQWRNIGSSMELIEMAHRVGAKTWLGLGSQAEYGPCQDVINELTTPEPTTLYGASKLSTQILGQRLCQEYGIRFAWLRLFSSYGPQDNPNWLIPYLIKTLTQRQRPKLTLAEQFWDYIYVEDVASAIRAVLDSKETRGVFNLGSGQAYQLKGIIERIRDSIDPELPLGFGEIDYRPDQVMHLQADISKLRLATGWLPRVEIDHGIKETIEWFKVKGSA